MTHEHNPTAEAGDIDALIKTWRASSRRTEQVAAELAAKIARGQAHPWDEMLPLSALADEYAVDPSTIGRVKRLLAHHGFLTKTGQRYHVA
jgi:DNA-binding transcriptional regulator YhcF (GntR family)